MTRTGPRKCPHCDTAITGSTKRPLNVAHDPRGITHRLTCTATTKDTTMTAPTIWDDITDRPTEWDKIERDRYDRPLIRQESGKAKSYRRTTTFVGCLEDTFKLSEWSQRHVAYGLARRPDLLMAVQSHIPGEDGETSDGKKEVNDLIKAAKEAAGTSTKATIGTALHKMTDRLDRGEDFPIPDLVRDDLDAYRRATAGLEWNHIERMTVHDGMAVAGTPDRVFTYQGKRYIGDLKTGSLDFGLTKIEMQLAVYAHSALYDIPTGNRSDLGVELDRAAVFHLPAGSGECRLLWVDIAAGWADVQIALEVWKQRSRKANPVPFTVEDALTTLVLAAASPDDLGELWRTHKADWTPAHSELARQRKAALSAVA